LLYALVRVIYNVYFHPLSRFPGPRGAACTGWWLTYTELGRGINLSTLRAQLHRKYGDIVRIAPNELHFARPTVYDEIYNFKNKWDKDYGVYRAFDMDESTLSQTDYRKAKHRRTLYANKFSRKATLEVQHLLVRVFHSIPLSVNWTARPGKSSDLYFGFQCFAADITTSFLFATCFNQISSPDFQGDIVKGIDMSFPTVTMAKHSLLFLWIVRYFPPSILTLLAPSLKGLVAFRKTLEDQVKNVLRDPKLLDEPSHRVMYGELLNPETNKGHPPPSALHLRHEALALYAAGSHPVAVTFMTGIYYLLRDPEAKQRLVDEVHTVWPVLDDQVPGYEDLEKLP
ncbi:cytochrome P450, partial [Russula emetica]